MVVETEWAVKHTTSKATDATDTTDAPNTTDATDADLTCLPWLPPGRQPNI
jgi:hypothetical protein